MGDWYSPLLWSDLFPESSIFYDQIYFLRKFYFFVWLILLMLSWINNGIWVINVHFYDQIYLIRKFYFHFWFLTCSINQKPHSENFMISCTESCKNAKYFGWSLEKFHIFGRLGKSYIWNILDDLFVLFLKPPLSKFRFIIWSLIIHVKLSIGAKDAIETQFVHQSLNNELHFYFTFITITYFWRVNKWYIAIFSIQYICLMVSWISWTKPWYH